MTCRSPRAAAALVLLALLPLALHAAPKFSYEDWGKVLGKYVDARGYVNYDALAVDRGDLDRFLAAIEKTSPRSNPELFPAKNDQLAYWLNAYNAQVFKGTLARGPERESVWKGGIFLSKIFDWFSGDFVAYEKAHGDPDGSQIDYVNRYRGSLPKVPKGYAIKFFEYDKGVNRQ